MIYSNRGASKIFSFNDKEDGTKLRSKSGLFYV